MNKINLITIISCLLLCACDMPHKRVGVKCDSGFDTGYSYNAWMPDGVIEWRENKHDSFKKRKMLAGEICSRY